VAEATEFPCTQAGIRDAVAAGGGPHTFACAAATTVVTTSPIALSLDVVLDGGGLQTVSSGRAHRVFHVETGGLGGDRQQQQQRRLRRHPGRPSRELIESRVEENVISSGITGASELVLVDSRVSGSQGGPPAAGVSAQELTALRSSIGGFTGPLASHAGALSVPAGGSAELTDSEVTGVSADGIVGGIQNAGELRLLRTRLSGNSGQTGALANAAGARAEIVDSEIVRNTGSFAGLPGRSRTKESSRSGAAFSRGTSSRPSSTARRGTSRS
jgi:hypothetical protein